MDSTEQINAFSEDLARLLERYSDEFDLSYAAIIGVLQTCIVGLSIESMRVSLDPDLPEDE